MRVEEFAISGEERPTGLLEATLVPGHRAHEPVSGLARLAPAVILGARPFRRLYQSPQRHRRATRLRREPLPMVRKQLYLAGDNAEARRTDQGVRAAVVGGEPEAGGASAQPYSHRQGIRVSPRIARTISG